MNADVYPPFPVNLNLNGERVLVVGGGSVAARKTDQLLKAGAVVTVVAPIADPHLADHPDTRWHQRPYRRGEAASYRLVVTATDDPTVNAQVARDGRAANVWVNSADDPANCAFTLPAVVTRGDFQIAISTNGRSPAMAKWARRQLEQQYTDVYAQLLEVLSEVRDEVRQQLGTSEVAGWDEAIGDELIEHIAAGQPDVARDRVRAALGVGANAAAHKGDLDRRQASRRPIEQEAAS